MTAPQLQSATLPQSVPEVQGIPSSAIHAFVDAVESQVHHLHSLMLLRHGHIVAQGWWHPYASHLPHKLFSLSKSFTSTAVGLAVAEGRLSIDASVISFFPEDLPLTRSPYLQAMRVRHLLTMTTGHATDPTAAVFPEKNWIRAFLAQPVEFAPGTHFVYNTAATYMLSAIVQRLTGQRLLQYLQPRLFTPLGIANPTWETSPQGIDVGGSGLSLTTADIARFGQLYLQKGMWSGQQLIPSNWIEQATAFQVDNRPSANPDWEQGYGFQFWRCRHGAYRGDGAFGQFCVVLPAQDTVIAITAGLGNMQQVLDLVWQYLLPALNASPLPEDPVAHRALLQRLASLRLPPVQGQPTSPLVAQLTDKTFTVAPNDDHVQAFTLHFGADTVTLILRNAYGEQRFDCGYQQWCLGTAAISSSHPISYAASGAWTADDTFVAQLWWLDGPSGRRLTCHFSGPQLIVEQEEHVSFGSTARAPLEAALTTGA